jgi:phage minor tail protein G
MFLKTAEFTITAILVLNELSALQRLSFLEFIATAEADAQKDEGDSETRRSAKMIGLAIRAGALLVAQSLWHNDPARENRNRTANGGSQHLAR